MPPSQVAKSHHIYLALRERISNGFYEGRGGLPGEQALAGEFQVSRVTLRRALSALKDDGYISTRRGAGTFFSERRKPEALQVDLTRAIAQLKSVSDITGVRLHNFCYEPAPANVARALKLAEGALVQRSVRVRLLDGQPFSHLVAYVPEILGRTYTDVELAEYSLSRLMERAGCIVDHAIQDVSAEAASPQVAAALGVEVGAPLLSLIRVAFSQSGAGVEYLRALYRPDRYTFRMDVGRVIERGPDEWAPLEETGARLFRTVP
jgi:GntR family transcriptional regulator